MNRMLNSLVPSCLLVVASCAWAIAEDARMLEMVGPTMGTRYMVKIYDPPPEMDAEVQIQIDRLLRQINDQMSTYLKHSDISRFNQSRSTDWFLVSQDVVTVVQYAQQVSQLTDGAFDITVGPLVNAWSFGSDPRTRRIPDEETLQRLREVTGYQHLSVQVDPPALRKEIPELEIDLSAIAKGFGVDKVVTWLNDAGAENVFVEIGGEVRASGDKDGQWWRVGIQMPDAAAEEVMIAHALNTGSGDDTSMATSGDYRNYFEVDGVRYSHTIDPRTGRPISHSLASVSVVAGTCMQADAWATAINVLGPVDGLEIAQQQNLHALLISRDGDGFHLAGTGLLARYSSDDSAAAASGKGNRGANENAQGNDQSIAVLVITMIAFAVLLFGMALGVVFGRRSISGSCGGLANQQNEDGSISCSLCSNPDESCRELRRRAQQNQPSA